MSFTIEVRELGHDEHADWDRLVAGSPRGSTCASPAYLDASWRASGGAFSILAAIRDGTILDGVTLDGESSRFGTRVETRPLLHYNGFVLRAGNGKYPTLRAALEVSTLAALEQTLGRLRLACLSLWPLERSAPRACRLRPDQPHGRGGRRRTPPTWAPMRSGGGGSSRTSPVAAPSPTT